MNLLINAGALVSNLELRARRNSFAVTFFARGFDEENGWKSLFTYKRRMSRSCRFEHQGNEILLNFFESPWIENGFVLRVKGNLIVRSIASGLVVKNVAIATATTGNVEFRDGENILALLSLRDYFAPQVGGNGLGRFIVRKEELQIIRRSAWCTFKSCLRHPYAIPIGVCSSDFVEADMSYALLMAGYETGRWFDFGESSVN